MELLQTKTDVGLVREHNEDVVIAIKHPKNKNIKLLIAADGMGGKQKGEVASSYVANSIRDWFIKKDIKIFSNINKTEELLSTYIKTLNQNLIKKYGRDVLGTTLVLAIINKNKTLILNVGDSRAYIYKNRNLIQVNEDDSDVWMYHKFGNVKKDHLRFFSNNSIVTACIGICDELCKVTSYVIENDYEYLLLFTDGVTDNITDKKIKSIIQRTDKKDVLDKIIREAVYIDQHFKIPYVLKKKFLANYVIPFPGRDNASGAIYIKDV